ncbi:MAG: hypothetical protein RhofKO_14640 [Rhodothermales bacterium]
MTRKFLHIALLALVLLPLEVRAQATPFQPIVPSLTPTAFGASAVADFDADGDLDLFLTGISADGSATPVYYRNDGIQERGGAEVWTFTGTPFDDLFFLQASLAVGDFENDNDVDVVISGDGNTVLLLNDGSGHFTASSLSLPGYSLSGGISQYIATSSLAWGDVDNDGFTDLVLTGEHTDRTFTPLLLRNEGGRFSSETIALDAIIAGQIALEDLDNDQDLDLVTLSRPNQSQTGHTPALSVWLNTNGQFRTRLTSIPGLEVGNFNLGDYDNDGRVDLLLSGASNATAIASASATVYLNERVDFRFHRSVEADALFGTWLDFDHDGFLDLLLSFDDQDATLDASNNFGSQSDSLSFTEPLSLQGIIFGAVQAADFDGDAQVDIFTTGLQTNGTVLPSAIIYHNRNPRRNQPPDAPTNLRAQFDGQRMTFTWDPATDAETPSAGLTYNLRVGTTPGGSDILSPLARTDGHRLVAQRGNVGSNTSWYLDGLSPNRTYHWSVQALDVNHIGSAFAEAAQAPTPAGVATEYADLPHQIALVGLYPNPFSDALYLRLESDRIQTVRVDLFDTLGRPARTPTTHRVQTGPQTLRLNDPEFGTLAPGMYYVRITTDDATINQAVLHF